MSGTTTAGAYSNSVAASDRPQGPAAPAGGNGWAGTASSSQLVAGLGQAYASVEAGKYNARIDRMNAAVAQARSADAIRRGEFGVNALRLEGRKVIGAQRAAYAGGNISVDSQVVADQAAGVDRSVELDVATLRENARLEAWGYDVSAADSRARASMSRAEGNQRAVGALGESASKAATVYRGLKDGG